MFEHDIPIAELAKKYESIARDDPARLEAEQTLDGLESREFYRGTVNGLCLTMSLLSAANETPPSWLTKRMTALAAKSSQLALPLGKLSVLRNPTDGQMHQAFVGVVGRMPSIRLWKATLDQMDICDAGSVKTKDFCLTWQVVANGDGDEDLYVSIRGGKGARDSI
jgi:hypothetical protein